FVVDDLVDIDGLLITALDEEIALTSDHSNLIGSEVGASVGSGDDGVLIHDEPPQKRNPFLVWKET
ncbi:Trypsin-1, partial [Caligus rogercresseyi]